MKSCKLQLLRGLHNQSHLYTNQSPEAGTTKVSQSIKSPVSALLFTALKSMFTAWYEKKQKIKNAYGELEWGGLLDNGVWFMAALIDRCLDTAAEVNKCL